MQCDIVWNNLSPQEWEARFATIKRSNILQSYTYARAFCPLNRLRAHWGLIMIDGQEAGLVQVLEVGVLWNLFHTVILDRGPLWFDGFGGAAHIKAFFETFSALYPLRFGRRRRILPEIDDGAAAKGILKQTGLGHLSGQKAYQTLWWDLDIDEETARATLKQKWRNSLNKAERSEVTIEWDDTGAFYPWLRGIYAVDKALRGYGGASPRLLDNLAKFSTQENPMIIGKASQGVQDIAFVAFIKHGRCATYQVGWSSDEGRKTNAHHLLLWQSRFMLKQRGVKQLDLGGVNDDTAAGIKIFKEGTGATLSTLVGHFT